MKIGVITDSVAAGNSDGVGAIELARAIIASGTAATLYVSEPLPENFGESGGAQGIPTVSLPLDFRLPIISVLERVRKLFPVVVDFVDGYRRANALVLLLDPHLDACIVYGGKGYRSVFLYKKQRRANIPALWYVGILPFYFYTYCDVGVPGKTPWCSPGKKTLYRLLDLYERRVVLRAINAFVGMSEGTAHLFKRYTGHAASAVLPGIAVAAIKENKPLSGRTVEILFCGEHLSREGVGEIAASVKALADRGYHVSFVVLGDSAEDRLFRSYKEALVERAREYGVVEALSFPGVPALAAPAGFFASADMVLHVHSTRESDAILFSAVAAGVPAIINEASSAGVLFTDRLTALFLKTLEPNAIAEAIRTLLEDEQLYRRLQKEGQALVRDSLSWRHVAETFIAMLGK